MDATNFVEKISQLVPNKQDILRNTTCSEEFADIYIQDLSIKRKATHTDMSPNFPVIDLIFNYDLSKLRIQVYSFNDVTMLQKTTNLYMLVGLRLFFSPF